MNKENYQRHSGVPVALDIADLPKVVPPNWEKTPEDRKMLRKRKVEHEIDMERFLGKNWKVLAKKLRILNVPTDSKVKSEMIHQAMEIEKNLNEKS